MSTSAIYTSTPITIRRPQFTYLHLSLLSLAPSPSLDALTTHKYLNAALRQFLGVTGTAIPSDILKIEARDVWIRVPREDGSAVVAALAGWAGEGGNVSWRVKGRGDWLGALVAKDGERGIWED